MIKNMNIKSQITELRESALKDLGTIGQTAELESWRVRYLGKKSRLSDLLRSLSGLPVEVRREAGAWANALKQELEAALAEKKQLKAARNPGRCRPSGYYLARQTLPARTSAPYESDYR